MFVKYRVKDGKEWVYESMKKLTSKQLKKKLWKLFSEYIRKRDGYKCITCGKQLDKNTSHAGHFVPKSRGLAIYFDERNVNCQCVSCNLFRHGNLVPYAVYLEKKYCHGIIQELEALSRTVKKISSQEYLDLIETYKNKLC